MRELEQRSAASTEEDCEVTAEPPRDRLRTEDACMWVTHLARERCQCSLVLVTRDNAHTTWSMWFGSRSSLACASATSAPIGHASVRELSSNRGPKNRHRHCTEAKPVCRRWSPPLAQPLPTRRPHSQPSLTSCSPARRRDRGSSSVRSVAAVWVPC